ncbi:MAG: hypothetical protein KC413_23190 [Anaerolineales bacterium]|nr:hypothetical protein [Anaerolineales bacterium]
MPALTLLLICLLSSMGVGLAVVGSAHAAQSQPGANGITQPTSGAAVSGVVTVTGTAVDPNYLRYELAFRAESGTAGDWVVFAEGDQPIQNGILAIWDTTIGRNVNAPIWPDGRYQLRLRVVRTDYNYSEYFVTGLIISNSGTPTPTPTPTITGTAAALATSDAQATPAAAETAVFAPLTPLPSLTPFPTPTMPPLPLNTPDEMGGTAVAAESRGLAGQLAQVDASPLASAFWQGVRLTAFLFAVLAFYLIARALTRRLWRYVWRSDRES